MATYNPFTGQRKKEPGFIGGALDTAYSDIQRRMNSAEAEKEAKRRKQFDAALGLYDTEAQKYRDQVMRAFAGSTELNAARQTRGVQSSINQYLARRGIAGESGLGASIASTAQGQLASQASQANVDFNSRLLQAMRSERDAFVRGEFDFWHRLQIMDYGAQIQKDLLQFQNKIRNDNLFRDAFFGTLNLGGQVLASFLPGGASVNTQQATQYSGGGGSRSLEDMYTAY